MNPFTIEIPCSIGDRFWIIVYSDRQVIEVECTGYGVYNYSECGRSEYHIWVNNVHKRIDYWKILFDEFEIRCFKTKEEAEKHL